MYVIYLTVLPSSHWPFPIPHICTVQAIKTLVSDQGCHPGPDLVYGDRPPALAASCPHYSMHSAIKHEVGKQVEEASEGGDEPDLHVQRDLAPGDVEGRKGDSAWERVLCVKAPWDSGRGMVDRNHSRLSEAA